MAERPAGRKRVIRRRNKKNYLVTSRHSFEIVSENYLMANLILVARKTRKLKGVFQNHKAPTNVNTMFRGGFYGR